MPSKKEKTPSPEVEAPEVEAPVDEAPEETGQTVEEAMQEAAASIVRTTPLLDVVVEKLKEEYTDSDIFLVSVGPDPFVFRSLDRLLYAEFRSRSEDVVDPILLEELVCELCVLHPEPEGFKDLMQKKGGLCTALSEEIYRVSGFAVVLPPVKL